VSAGEVFLAAGERLLCRAGDDEEVNDQMAGPFSVDHATLGKAATDVQTTRSEVDGELKKLRSVVSELSGAWVGVAASGFQSVMTRFDTDANSLLNALEDIGNLLQKSGAQHQATDEQQNEQMNKFNAALNG
jgi:early secretory antigenic target protein ESAT-6